jgi:hypothetical protein
MIGGEGRVEKSRKLENGKWKPGSKTPDAGLKVRHFGTGPAMRLLKRPTSETGPYKSKVGSCVHQAGDYVVDSDYADGTVVVVEDSEHAEIVFVEKFEDIFFVGVGGDGKEGIGF